MQQQRERSASPHAKADKGRPATATVASASAPSVTASVAPSGSPLLRTLLVLLLLLLSVHLLVWMREGSEQDLQRLLAHSRAPARGERVWAEAGGAQAEGQAPMQPQIQQQVLFSNSPPFQNPTVPSIPIPSGPPQRATYTLAPGVTPLANLSDPFNARTMIVSFASLNIFQELYDFWQPLEEFFLKPHQQQFGLGSNLNFTLFYEVFPQDTRKEMKAWLKEMKFTHVRGSPTENYGLMVYRSPGGTLLQTAPLAMNLPEYVADDISLTHRGDWMKCGRNKTFPFPYVFYNTVFTYHIMRHPLLANYDYYMKIDTDIIFKQPSPFSLFGDMAQRKCIFSHANIVHAWPNCQWRANVALAAYAESRNVIPNSLQHRWCSDESLYFYGNFVIGYLGLLRSAENLDYMHFLFHTWREGYFKHRWTDQAVWPKILCLFEDIPSVKTDERICDYSHWRHKIFKHV